MPCRAQLPPEESFNCIELRITQFKILRKFELFESGRSTSFEHTDGGQDLRVLRKSARFLFGKYLLAVHRDLKNAAARFDQLRLDCKLVFNGFGQADRLGLIVSKDTKLDRYFHRCASLWPYFKAHWPRKITVPSVLGFYISTFSVDDCSGLSAISTTSSLGASSPQRSITSTARLA